MDKEYYVDASDGDHTICFLVRAPNIKIAYERAIFTANDVSPLFKQKVTVSELRPHEDDGI